MNGFFVKAKYKADDDLRYVTTRGRMPEYEFKQFCEDYAHGEYRNIVELHVERIDD